MSEAFDYGTPVIVILHSPREKCWGLLDEIGSAGVTLRGLDLNSFDDWVHSIIHDEQFVGVCDLFFPMWRVERVARDEPAGDLPAMFEQLEQKTGHSVQQLLSFDLEPDEIF